MLARDDQRGGRAQVAHEKASSVARLQLATALSHTTWRSRSMFISRLLIRTSCVWSGQCHANVILPRLGGKGIYWNLLEAAETMRCYKVSDRPVASAEGQSLTCRTASGAEDPQRRSCQTGWQTWPCHRMASVRMVSLREAWKVDSHGHSP